MGQTEHGGAGAGQADGVGGASGAGEGAGVTHIPGTAFRVLPDGSVARFITSPGSLLDHTIRLQGAVNDIRGLVSDQDVIDALDRWGV